MGGREMPTPAGSSHPAAPKEVEKTWQTFVQWTLQRHRLTKRLRPNRESIVYTPYFHFTTELLKTYLQQNTFYQVPHV